MSIKNAYLAKIYEDVAAKNANEPEFLQTVAEVLETIEPVIELRPDLVEAGVVERMVEPEATAFSSTLRSVRTRAVFASTPQLTFPL